MQNMSKLIEQFYTHPASSRYLRLLLDMTSGIITLHDFWARAYEDFCHDSLFYFIIQSDGTVTPSCRHTWYNSLQNQYFHPPKKETYMAITAMFETLYRRDDYVHVDLTELDPSLCKSGLQWFFDHNIVDIYLIPVYHNNSSVGFLAVDFKASSNLESIAIPFYSIAVDYIVHADHRQPVSVMMDSVHRSITAKTDEKLAQFFQQNYFDLSSFLSALEHLNHYVYFGDLQTNTFFINDSLASDFGFSGNIATNLLVSWEERIPLKQDKELYIKDIADIMKHKRTLHDIRYRVRDVHGNLFWIRCCGRVKWDATMENPLFFAGTISRIESAFQVDPVTGLPREEAALSFLQSLLNLKHPISLIGFRLNNFREINEMYGRITADNLIRTISNGLTNHFSDYIDIFRLDGLRFVAVLSNALNEKLEASYAYIRDHINETFSSFQFTSNSSAYFALMQDITNADPQSILGDMMIMLDLAKESPNEPYVMFSTQHLVHRKNMSRLLLAINEDIQSDFRNFRTVIQPTVDAVKHCITSGEMLCRWQHEGKDISPGIFIPILERTRRIQDLGRWIFDQAVTQVKQITQTHPSFTLSFNVSYHQVLDPAFVPFMQETLRRHNIEGSHLVAELTETNYNENPRALQDFLLACQNLGIKLALDDFGTGYSSLELLLKHPSDIVKIDRSLMKEMSSSSRSREFINSIVYSCHKFDKKVVVEGVETEAELSVVTEAGCDYIQGFYFYRPLEIASFYDTLKANPA